MNDSRVIVGRDLRNPPPWDYAHESLAHGLGDMDSFAYGGILDANESGAVIDFIVELVAEIERLQTELIEITDMVIGHNDNTIKRLDAILAQVRGK